MQSLRRLTVVTLHRKDGKKRKSLDRMNEAFLIECGDRGFYDHTLFSLQTTKLSAPDAVANLKYVAPIAFME